MDDLDLGVDNLSDVHPIDKIDDFIKTRVDMARIISNHAETKLGPLPEIIISNLRNRDVVAILHPIDDLTKDLALTLERGITGNEQINLTDTYHHIILSLPEGYKLGVVSSLM